MKRLAILSMAALLSACATHAPAPEARNIPVEVDKPVAASCVPANLGDAPAKVNIDSDLKAAAADAAARYQLLFAYYLGVRGYLNEVVPVIAGCRNH